MSKDKDIGYRAFYKETADELSAYTQSSHFNKEQAYARSFASFMVGKYVTETFEI